VIRKIAIDYGNVSCVLGTRKRGNKDGDIKTAELSFPCSLIVDIDGTIYFTDTGRVRTVTGIATKSVNPQLSRDLRAIVNNVNTARYCLIVSKQIFYLHETIAQLRCPSLLLI